MLIQYVRNKRGEKKGVVVADKIDGSILVGYSLCHSRLDKFNKEDGLALAVGRMYLGYNHVPTTVRPVINNIQSRAERYFKE